MWKRTLTLSSLWGKKTTRSRITVPVRTSLHIPAQGKHSSIPFTRLVLESATNPLFLRSSFDSKLKQEHKRSQLSFYFEPAREANEENPMQNCFIIRSHIISFFFRYITQILRFHADVFPAWKSENYWVDERLMSTRRLEARWGRWSAKLSRLE